MYIQFKNTSFLLIITSVWFKFTQIQIGCKFAPLTSACYFVFRTRRLSYFDRTQYSIMYAKTVGYKQLDEVGCPERHATSVSHGDIVGRHLIRMHPTMTAGTSLEYVLCILILLAPPIDLQYNVCSSYLCRWGLCSVRRNIQANC